MSRTVGWFVLALTVVLAPSAWSQEDTSSDVQHDVSLTISPIHLAMPVGEVTAEFRVMDTLGVAGILGLGVVSADVSSSDEDATFTVFEAGAQGRYYVIGSFDHGMQIGVEVLLVYISGDVETVSGSGNGLSLGGFIGYKVAMDVGFSFDAQLGVSYLVLNASAEDEDEGVVVSEDEVDIIPLLNLNVGWSF